jgi:5-methylcytosine-specific restriction endonuclease McrA
MSDHSNTHDSVQSDLPWDSIEKSLSLDGKLIPLSRFFTIDDVERLKLLAKKFGKIKLVNLIENAPKNQPGYLVIDVQQFCLRCHKEIILKICKSKLVQLISDRKERWCFGDSDDWKLCDECKEIKKVKEYFKNSEYEENQRIIKENNTKHFIEIYLNPSNSWKEGTPQKDRWQEIRNANVDSHIVAEAIKKLDYYEFLKTPYWKAIAQYAKYRAGFRCQLCNAKGSLATHHRSYQNHGYEAHSLDDLIVLCESCHQKHHDIHE